jgi:hypothetical protein
MDTSEQLPDDKLPTSEINPRRKRIMFIAGFLGWFVVNGLAWFLLAEGNFSGSYAIPNIIILPANVIVLLILTIKRSTRPIGQGILVALAVNLLIALIIGVMGNGLCFVPFFLK